MNISKILESLYGKSLVVGRKYSSKCIENQTVPKHQAFYCRDCEAFTEMCVVEDWVWANIHKPQKSDIVLCFKCMERRLKRRITLKDLKYVPCNAPYFIGFQMDRF